MTKNSIKSKKFFIILIFVLAFIACVIVANYISIALLSANSNSDETFSDEIEYFMLSLSKSKLEKEAEATMQDYQKEGAGGFVWKIDDYYYVLSSAYLNKNDAQLKQVSIKQEYGIDCEILPIKFKSIKIEGNFTSEEKKVLNKSLSICNSFYSSIFDIAVSIDTGVYNDTTAKLSVNATINKINTIYANFDTLFPGPCPKPLESLQKLQEKVIYVAKQLLNDERMTIEQTYSSSLKYRYLQVLSLYEKFCENN